VRILLDTHAFLWLVTDHPNLSRTAKKLFLDPHNDLFVSAVSGFEISVKCSLGKLRLTEPPRDFMENRIRNNALSRLSVSLQHTYRLSHLPFHHKDPFDRLLVAQAQEEDLPILTADPAISAYAVEVFW
jgi:PIN domain nuclease of toxin-antitoxin system